MTTLASLLPDCSESPRCVLFLFRVVVHRCLGVDDHVIRVIASDLNIIVPFLGMPC